MTRTRTAPWDYNRYVPTPPKDLFADCPACNHPIAVKDGELISCYECNTYYQLPPEAQEQFKALDIVVAHIPPEPETFTEAVNATYGTPADWPWTEEDYLSELDNHRPETTF